MSPSVPRCHDHTDSWNCDRFTKFVFRDDKVRKCSMYRHQYRNPCVCEMWRLSVTVLSSACCGFIKR